MEPISPWSRNPGLADLDGDDLDVVAARPRPTRMATLPGERIRRGARVVRWCALLLTVISVLSSALTTYGVDDPAFRPYGGGWGQFGQFLSGLSWSVGFAALVLAASHGLIALAARLDLERALAER